MINLAGRKDANKYIEEELYLASIPLHTETSTGEVSYTIIGKLEGWIFRRAWYYYMVSCPDGLGLPYNIAAKLHDKKYPISDEQCSTLGQSIRVNGHCGCPHPKEFQYPTLSSIEEEFIKARKQLPDIDFNTQIAFDDSCLRELDGVRYIRLYHIDTQVGLNEFSNIVRRSKND